MYMEKFFLLRIIGSQCLFSLLVFLFNALRLTGLISTSFSKNLRVFFAPSSIYSEVLFFLIIFMQFQHNYLKTRGRVLHAA